MVFQYEHITLKERQYGLILPGEIGKWIKAVYASADAAIEVMLFVFDVDGNLRSANCQCATRPGSWRQWRPASSDCTERWTTYPQVEGIVPLHLTSAIRAQPSKKSPGPFHAGY